MMIVTFNTVLFHQPKKKKSQKEIKKEEAVMLDMLIIL